MIREICKDETFLSQKAEPATPEDLQTAADLLETLAHHKEGCVGMAANMIGVNKRIIAACQIMAEGKNITESWQQTGFADYSSFLRNFRKIYGISPKEYRENNRSLIISQ